MSDSPRLRAVLDLVNTERTIWILSADHIILRRKRGEGIPFSFVDV